MLLEKPAKTSLKKHYLKFVLAGIIIVFVWIHYDKIEHPVNPDYGAIRFDYLKSCTMAQMPDIRAPLKLWMLCASERVFGNINAIPFLFSTGIIPMTYLLARKITKSETRSVIAAGLMLGSPILAYLGTSAALSSEWAFFFIASMYFLYKRPEIAGVLFVASLSAKGLPMLMLPALFYFMYKADIPQKKKAFIIFAEIGGLMIIFPFLGITNFIQDNGFGFHPEEFDHALRDLWFVFRSDKLQFAILPISAYILYRSNHPMSRPLLYLMGSFYSLCFLLPVFSIYQMFDYRMIPLIVWGAIGITIPHQAKKVKSF